MVKIITEKEFSDEVLKFRGTALVEFWADWCEPCLAMNAALEDTAEEHPEIAICKVNIEENTALADQFGIEIIPTLIVFQNGEKISEGKGVLSKKEIEVLLSSD